jgi:two-component system, OmpR family, sensor histidine kinase BaeS
LRSLTSKLILAFLLVSLISIGVIVGLTHFATNREFNRLISDKYKTQLADELATFYKGHSSWEGVDQATFSFSGGQSTTQPENRPSFFAVTDANGVVVMESFQHKLGKIATAETLGLATPILVDGETVGFLVLETPPNRRDPREEEFLSRLDLSLLLSAIGTIIFALFFGVILSRSITNPVLELTSATHAMASGKLNQKVVVRSKDEIGELAQSFNKMSDDLASSFNLRKQMTADIAHELRTPLSLIIGHAEAVHDGVLPPTNENFEIIREEANRLEQLVNDLRILSLADAGELPLDIQPSDINKLLGDIKTHYTIQLNQKGITLDLETDPGILKADLDSARISQVLTNIIDNALHYTTENGRIVISTKQIRDDVEIVIQDNGPGVKPEEALHLFDRFYRADPSRTRDDGGSGLGLAIAKSIIEMHKGRISAESERGNGLKVTIQLPIAR